MNLRRLLLTPAWMLAAVIALGEWTGLARAILRAPVYAAVLDLVLVVLCLLAVRQAWSHRSSLKLRRLDGPVVGPRSPLCQHSVRRPATSDY